MILYSSHWRCKVMSKYMTNHHLEHFLCPPTRAQSGTVQASQAWIIDLLKGVRPTTEAVYWDDNHFLSLAFLILEMVTVLSSVVIVGLKDSVLHSFLVNNLLLRIHKDLHNRNFLAHFLVTAFPALDASGYSESCRLRHRLSFFSLSSSPASVCPF